MQSSRRSALLGLAAIVLAATLLRTTPAMAAQNGAGETDGVPPMLDI
jgi:hypothetical protein